MNSEARPNRPPSVTGHRSPITNRTPGRDPFPWLQTHLTFIDEVGAPTNDMLTAYEPLANDARWLAAGNQSQAEIENKNHSIAGCSDGFGMILIFNFGLALIPSRQPDRKSTRL